MAILVSVDVPHGISQELSDKRQSVFDSEVDEICKRYLANGAMFNRGFNFVESSELSGAVRNMHTFPEHLNIPVEAQQELSIAWAKLFDVY